METGDFRREVVLAVKRRLEQYDWYVGVSLDGIEEFYPDDLDGAIDNAYYQTLYWDAPNHGLGL